MCFTLMYLCRVQCIWMLSVRYGELMLLCEFGINVILYDLGCFRYRELLFNSHYHFNQQLNLHPQSSFPNFFSWIHGLKSLEFSCIPYLHRHKRQGSHSSRSYCNKHHHNNLPLKLTFSVEVREMMKTNELLLFFFERTNCCFGKREILVIQFLT